MDKYHVIDKPVLDKIEVYIPPRLTIKIATLAAEQGRTLNEVIREAITDYIKLSKQ